ncbi:MAG: phosphatase PAP2 family protein [Gammaproteobacteria bacterium]|jgi:undecaprenyl-diphosphatase
MNRLQQWDVDLCIRFNRVSAYRSVEWFFRVVSRLGNGVFWYSLILVLPAVYGTTGWHASLHMLLSTVPALLIYKALKKTTSRQRPCKVHPRIKQKTAALDQFSFPSGHTLHAVNFTLVCGHYLPELLAPLSLFSALVALSRPVLGLHYPSDVAAGALLGTLVAAATVQVPLFA